MNRRRLAQIFSFLKPKLWLSFVLLAALVLIGIALADSWSNKSAVDEEISALKAEAEKAEAQNSQFKKMLSYLESEQFVEEQAKLKMGLKRPGEKVAVITESLATGSEADQVASATPDKISFGQARWQRWLEYFLAKQ